MKKKKKKNGGEKNQGKFTEGERHANSCYRQSGSIWA